MQRLLGRISEFLFCPPQDSRGARACQAAFLTVLFVLGALHWAAFLDLGEMRMTVEDWPLQLMYGNVLKQAVTQHTMPWHISRQVLNTTRFLAIPETTLSPQALALAWLPVGLYALCNILLLYTAGFIGCLLIRRKYRLSAFAAAVLFLLFNFNGFITSHVGVGHAWVLGYFLLPFFCLLTLNLAEGKAGLGAAAAMAFVLFAMLLQGSFHIVIWCCMFLALLAVAHRPSRATVAWTILFTALLGAFRFLPSAIEYRNKSAYHFVSGHRSLYDLFQSFVAIKERSEFSIGGIFGRQGWWEYDYYVGALGLAALIFLGIVVRWRKDSGPARAGIQGARLAAGLMALLSMSYFWAFIAMLPLPLVNSERASSRFLIIPVLMLLVLSCARMQEALDRLIARGNLEMAPRAGVPHQRVRDRQPFRPLVRHAVRADGNSLPLSGGRPHRRRARDGVRDGLQAVAPHLRRDGGFPDRAAHLARAEEPRAGSARFTAMTVTDDAAFLRSAATSAAIGSPPMSVLLRRRSERIFTLAKPAARIAAR